MNYITQICHVLKKQTIMSKTAHNICQNRGKSKSLNEVGLDLLNKFQSILTTLRPAVSLAIIGISAAGLLYAVAIVKSAYLYQLAPALAIILMVLVLRFFSIPIKVQSKEESNK
ncbi:MAG: hypothetical protein ACI8P5_001365 [Bacteroidia bacterium]|jgi:hypothetical protein